MGLPAVPLPGDSTFTVLFWDYFEPQGENDEIKESSTSGHGARNCGVRGRWPSPGFGGCWAAVGISRNAPDIAGKRRPGVRVPRNTSDTAGKWWPGASISGNTPDTARKRWPRVGVPRNTPDIAREWRSGNFLRLLSAPPTGGAEVRHISNIPLGLHPGRIVDC
jgi:hypothetical protein